MKKNIVLIGMPGSGKSTIGVLLAKAINYQFIDGDLLIQRQEKKTLVDIINEKGIDAFLAIENQVLREINTEASVIATGGSAIFSEEAMKHLGEQGLIVYLDVSCEEIIRRVNNISTRGIAMKPGKICTRSANHIMRNMRSSRFHVMGRQWSSAYRRLRLR